jgi:hypothetical protein
LTPEKRPQDPHGDGTGLTFTTAEHGGEYPDDMPQAIILTDVEGRSCTYVPVKVDGRVVDSKGFTCLLPLTDAERIAQLERVLSALIDHLEVVGCYDRTGERLGDQVPAVQQARAVLGPEAWARIMGTHTE